MEAPSILITESLQNDMVKPIGPYDSLPNLLHVGHHESMRLMGENAEQGPIARVMTWAYRHSPEDLSIIHIRDWHDPSDPSQRGHLEHFGPHCLKDTPGAEFAFKIPEGFENRPTHIINSPALNDFHGTGLEAILEPLAGRGARVGIVGVWTEAKVTYLCYELATRYPQMQIGVCSALTASSSRTQHYLALDQLRKLLAVRIFDSVADFIEFLGGEAAELKRAQADVARVGALKIELEPPLQLNTGAERLVRYLFRDSRNLHLKSLDGGFSGNLVLASRSDDRFGHREVPHVVKIGPRSPIAAERASFERIESVLGNHAPRVVDFADGEELGAIKYRYAAMGEGKAVSLQKLYQAGASEAKIRRYLKDVFGDKLGRMYAAARLERCNLLEYYQFSPSLAERVEERAFQIGKSREKAARLADFYASRLPRILSNASPEYRYFSYVHGDLNGANIIVDDHENVWLIDFFHTHRGHVLKDLLKFENDLLYIFTPLKNQADLKQAVALSEALTSIDDLWRAPRFASFSHAGLKRAAAMVKFLRGFYAPLIHSDRSPYQAFVAQMRYAVHTLSFDEPTILQKRWALETSLRLADRITELADEGRSLRVDWVGTKVLGESLGMTLLPGRRDRDRSLDRDLVSLKNAGASRVVCLATERELRELGVPHLLAAYEEAGLKADWLPIPDQRTPDRKSLAALLTRLEESIDRGERVVLHCVGGLGRSGLVAACLLKRRGLSASAAIRLVRQSRSQRAVESPEQERFVSRF